jgi:hypothetical protein
MLSQITFQGLVFEFKIKLNRNLTMKEMEFIGWVYNKDQEGQYVRKDLRMKEDRFLC